MKWNIYNIKEIHSKWKEWDRLNGLYYGGHPFFDSRFIKPCIQFFGGDHLKLAELENNQNEITGMLIIESSGFGSWALFVVPQMQIVPILLNPENRGKEITALVKALPCFCWRLECLYQDSDFTPFHPNEKFLISKIFHCTTTRIGLASDFLDYWGKRKKNLQKNLNRYFNKLEKEKIEVSFNRISQLKELRDGIIRYGLLESNGWKGEAGTAIHPNNIQGAFYNAVLSSFGRDQQASIYELYFKEILVASRLCINNQEMSIILKVTHNEKYKKYSPGNILLYKLVQMEYEREKFKKIEFYTNASKEQKDWASSIRNINHYEVHRNKLFETFIDLKNGKLSRWRS